MENAPLCKCGCGNPVARHYTGKRWNQYIHTHHAKGNTNTKGHIPWNKGLKGIQVPWNKGRTASAEERKKMSDSHMGQKAWNKGLTKEDHPSIARIAESMKENKHCKGWVMPDEIRERVGAAKRGKKNYNWKGGVSSYPSGWNERLKRSIRESHDNACQLCGLTAETDGRKLSVHHINGIKYDIYPDNLVVLCKRCHVMTIYHDKLWQAFFEGEKFLEIYRATI